MTDQNSKKLYGLLGRNISYSLSPAMHNAAFKHFGIPAEYVIFDKKPEELKSFFENEVLTGKISGLNVTVPYKLDVKKILDEYGAEVEPLAKLSGAVNTIMVADGKLKGYNTDASGFLKSLNEDAGYRSQPHNGSVFVIGAGGGSHAVCFVLASTYSELKNIYVYDEKETQADILKENFQNARKVFPHIPDVLRIVEENEREEIIKTCNLIANTTPCGTNVGDPIPISPEWLKPGMTVYDLVYARETELIKAAKEKGLKASGGLGMLVMQGAMSFGLWTGEKIEEIKNIMKQAALEKLANKKA
ncbi:MAG: shikimate dehydrogenase [Candidatus Omnitrophica bacterium]|nr:shikimate dehydrogenase [Candidatus Omnitrophota bacterium]